jgi:hypothetical protein
MLASETLFVLRRSGGFGRGGGLDEDGAKICDSANGDSGLKAIEERLAVLLLVGLLDGEEARASPMEADEAKFNEDRELFVTEGEERCKNTHRQINSSLLPPFSLSIALSSAFASLHTPFANPSFPSAPPTFFAFSTACKKSFCSAPAGTHCLIAFERDRAPEVDLRYSTMRVWRWEGERARRIFELRRGEGQYAKKYKEDEAGLTQSRHFHLVSARPSADPNPP